MSPLLRGLSGVLVAFALAGCVTVDLPAESTISQIVEDTRLGRINACHDPRWIAWRFAHGEQGTAQLTALRDQAKAKSEALEPPPPNVDPYEWSDQNARLEGLLHIARAALAATDEPRWHPTLANQEERVRAWRTEATTHAGDGFARATARRAVWAKARAHATQDLLAERTVEARMALCLFAKDHARSEADAVLLVTAALDRNHWPSEATDGDGATRAVLGLRASDLGRAYLKRNLARLDTAAANKEIPLGGWSYLRSAEAKYATPAAFATHLRRDIKLVRAFFAGLPPPRTVGDELYRRTRIDQFAIGAESRLIREHPASPPRDRAKKLLEAATAEIVKENAARMRVLLRDRDWFDDAKDGENATLHAWLLVQHADHDTALQRDVLRRMEPLLGTRVTHQHYAYLWDRVAVGEKRLQRYGTQMACTGGKRGARIGLEDPARVDERRKQMGLGSWKDYVASFDPCN